MTKILDFLTSKGIISMSVILSAITFGFVSKIIEYIYDPIFYFFFPSNKLDKIRIKLTESKHIELGLALLELIKVLLYLVITFHSLNIIIDRTSHTHLH
jgi:hypothetical protein